MFQVRLLLDESRLNPFVERMDATEAVSAIGAEHSSLLVASARVYTKAQEHTLGVFVSVVPYLCIPIFLHVILNSLFVIFLFVHRTEMGESTVCV